MPLDAPSASQISQVIAQSTAPAFLRGAVAGLISVLVSRLERILDRSRAINTMQGETSAILTLKADIPRLEERARLVNLAVFPAISSGIVTTMLIMVAFALAFFELPHEKGVAALLVVAVLLFTIAPAHVLREIRISLRKSDHL
ncbi:hypothetical protein GCM10007874_36950 [Labrys miyagiensis]|uniref:DUF2721 domain-containing protein n=1 Tax=Labrys miyagiensis TaxID=346912 RepID=A0ABQ6CLN2_9HYPH|nr:DUF2721 domain-containing protein [Labrys miyagiensis]GLS20678.1 hypothetical protein GCM10007874_36950 [Labrys miyagiensis]